MSTPSFSILFQHRQPRISLYLADSALPLNRFLRSVIGRQLSNTVGTQQVQFSLSGGQLDDECGVSRISANAGSYSNITVSVADDSGGTYDVNRLNNIYARIINGL
ncbi:hypothetical protein [Spirosoma aerolatum]|uniref:hypothetical protein n=1 Tax=Spirosoma aerolatum TaxID=1211326 RepID=UPI0009AC42B2|nr:hypothetical protein [Spirosoma aerolatum]